MTPQECQSNLARYEETHTFRGFPLADLRALYTRNITPDNLKKPWKAVVPKNEIEAVKAAFIYFHADEPVVVRRLGAVVEMEGKGYQGW